jgi:hypothetical protein
MRNTNNSSAVEFVWPTLVLCGRSARVNKGTAYLLSAFLLVSVWVGKF